MLLIQAEVKKFLEAMQKARGQKMTATTFLTKQAVASITGYFSMSRTVLKTTFVKFI